MSSIKTTVVSMIFLILEYIINTNASGVVDHYTICKTGLPSAVENSSRSLTTELRCAASCSKTEGCQAFNFCFEDSAPASQKLGYCQMLDGPPFECAEDVLPSFACRYGFFRSSSALKYTRSPCQNGGVVSSPGHCQCPVQYAGQHCERLIRDCGEAWNPDTNDYHGEEETVLNIQPDNAPQPFKVFCETSSSKSPLTTIMQEDSDYPLTWLTAKQGYDRDGDLITNSRYPSGFFIGLDSLHYLTSQDKYYLAIRIFYGGNTNYSYYSNAKVGAEVSGYEINYDRFSTNDDEPAGNGLSGPLPLKFSTADNDTLGCAGMNGGAGWYGTTCDGKQSSVFSAPRRWPLGGLLTTAEGVLIFLYMM